MRFNNNKPRSEVNENQNIQPLGSKNDRPTELHASNIDISNSEDEDHLLRASDMRELRSPARPIYKSVPNVSKTIFSKEDSEEEDYHMVIVVN